MKSPAEKKYDASLHSLAKNLLSAYKEFCGADASLISLEEVKNLIHSSVLAGNASEIAVMCNHLDELYDRILMEE